MSSEPREPGVLVLACYFLKLGTVGFGGPVALVGYMHRDLVERRRWLGRDDYALGLALAQVMPGPLAAQLATAIGFLKAGFLGATAVGFAFILPSFLMVVALAALYVALSGLWWVSALFYTVGASMIGIIAIAACKPNIGLAEVPGVEGVRCARIRWVGHQLWAGADVLADGAQSLASAHAIAETARHRLLHACRSSRTCRSTSIRPGSPVKTIIRRPRTTSPP